MCLTPAPSRGRTSKVDSMENSLSLIHGTSIPDHAATDNVGAEQRLPLVAGAVKFIAERQLAERYEHR
jgi:hypothetical protein